LTPTDRRGLQILALICASPVIIPAAFLAILWSFIEFGWYQGCVRFNHFFQPQNTIIG
jgi:hypothetical protein